MQMQQNNTRTRETLHRHPRAAVHRNAGIFKLIILAPIKIPR